MSQEHATPDRTAPERAANLRPEILRPPANLSKSPPIPSPGPPVDEAEPLSPTRYGDWEHKGIASDF